MSSSDAVAAFYSKPSGVQRGGGRAMSFISQLAIPLWQKAKEKMCEKASEVQERLCGTQVSKVAQGVRSMGDRQKLEEVGGSLSMTRAPKRKLKVKKRKRTKVRFTDDDDDSDDEPRRKKHKRSRSQIARVLGSDTY